MSAIRAVPAPIDITEHVGLVHWTIARHKFAWRACGALAFEDLVQQGMLGLMTAAERFDPSRGCRFSTFATWHIRQQIGRHLQDAGAVVRVPVHLQEKRYKRGERVLPVVRSLDAPLSRDSETTWLDMLADDIPDDPEETIDAKGASARLALLFDLAQLSPRARLVLRLRATDVSLQQIGERIGLTRERTRQIEAAALAKLRRAAGVPADAPKVPIGHAPYNPFRTTASGRRNPNRLRSKDPCRMQIEPL